jgi:hypothetical protein
MRCSAAGAAADASRCSGGASAGGGGAAAAAAAHSASTDAAGPGAASAPAAAPSSSSPSSPSSSSSAASSARAAASSAASSAEPAAAAASAAATAASAAAAAAAAAAARRPAAPPSRSVSGALFLARGDDGLTSLSTSKPIRNAPTTSSSHTMPRADQPDGAGAPEPLVGVDTRSTSARHGFSGEDRMAAAGALRGRTQRVSRDELARARAAPAKKDGRRESISIARMHARAGPTGVARDSAAGLMRDAQCIAHGEKVSARRRGGARRSKLNAEQMACTARVCAVSVQLLPSLFRLAPRVSSVLKDAVYREHSGWRDARQGA